MKTTITLEGMGCPRCEAKVKKSLEESFSCEVVSVSHKTGKAVVENEAPLDENKVREVLDEIGFDFVSME